MPLRTIAAVCLALAPLSALSACDARPTSPAPSDGMQSHAGAETSDPAAPVPAADADDPHDLQDLDVPDVPPPAAVGRPPTPVVDEEPREIRRAQRATMLYDAPLFSAAFRGKIARGETFAVYGDSVQDADAQCKDGWGRVGVRAFACLTRSTVTKKPAPRTLPVVPTDRVVPFVYAKRRGPDTPAPIWRSRAALRRGADPIGELDVEHDYAFVAQRWANRERVLVDEGLRTVKEADVRRFRPSELEGRDLATDPLPPEGTLAWVITWPHAPRLEAADPDAEVAGNLEFHATVVLDDTPTRRRGKDFYPLRDGTGWVEASAVRRYIAADPVVGIADDAVWVDVEITQQTLTLWRGSTPSFVTLISSGTGRNPTPLGIYRMESKHALTDMRSKPGDDDAYYVEAVPWAMYFDGRFALHGAYWHNRFGSRLSHGCVNLAPKDAKRVFEALSPALPDGWLTVYEHAEDLGSVVRVRKLRAVPPDRRAPPRKRTAT